MAGMDMYAAACDGDWAAVAEALAAGLDPDTTDPSGYGYSLLFAACRNGHASVVRLLLDRGAAPNVTTRFEKAPLVVAVSEGHARIVDQLLAAGARVNHPPGEHGPLTAAAERGREALVDQLLAAGAEPGRPGRHGITPLHAVVDSSAVGVRGRPRERILRALLRAGANLDAQADDGCTPVLSAVARGDVETAALLVAAGADVDRPDHGGRSARSLAHQFGGPMAEAVAAGAASD